jgi:hypothetical protein
MKKRKAKRLVLLRVMRLSDAAYEELCPDEESFKALSQLLTGVSPPQPRPWPTPPPPVAPPTLAQRKPTFPKPARFWRLRRWWCRLRAKLDARREPVVKEPQ